MGTSYFWSGPYGSDDFAKFFSQHFANGVIKNASADSFKVVASGTNMTVTLKAGSGIIDGRLFIEESDVSLTHDAGEATLDRIDRIVLRQDENASARTITVAIKKGTPATSPLPPSLQTDDYIKEITLAQVRVKAGRNYIDSTQVTDEREWVDIVGNANRYNPHFFIENTTSIGTVNPGELRGVPFQTIRNNKQFTQDGYYMVVSESGVYSVDMQATWSGMNSGIGYELIIRKTRVNGTVESDRVHKFKGATGWGSNDGGIPSMAKTMFSLDKGDKLSFYVRHGDSGVRAVLEGRMTATKVSK